jgi:small subunit ribosomal protein S6
MTAPSPTYDLVLLLDVAAEEASRAKILADVEGAISKQGELLRHDEWGRRSLAYQIAHKDSAEYHLFQFHGSPEMLAGLQRSLSITDDVVRFRIVKLKPGTPAAPDMSISASVPAAHTSAVNDEAA